MYKALHSGGFWFCFFIWSFLKTKSEISLSKLVRNNNNVVVVALVVTVKIIVKLMTMMFVHYYMPCLLYAA